MVANGSDIQVDKGSYTRIHNAILENLARYDFTGREYACLLYLLRMTYGFSRKEVKLSNSDIGKATGFDPANVSRAMRRLVEGKVIIRSAGNPNTAPTWQFNKYFEQWTIESRVKTATEPNENYCQNDNSSDGDYCQNNNTPCQNDNSTIAEMTIEVLPKQQESYCQNGNSYISAKESIKESIKDKEIAAAAPPDAGWVEVCNVYQDNIGSFTTITSDLVHDAYAEFGARVVVAAIKEAVVNNKRKWSYVDGILKGWRANGRADRIRKEGQPKVKKQYAYTDPVTGEKRMVTA